MTKEITRAQAAELAGVAPKTFSGYVARDQAPRPVRYVSRTPLWDEDEIRDWMQNRAGRGSRTTARALKRAVERVQRADSTE